MKLPLSWVNDFVDLKGVDYNKLAAQLVNIGFEVEEIIKTGSSFSNVFTGKILSIKKHENADNLRVCLVSLGKKNISVITNDKKVSENDTVAVAVEGAVLADGFTIRKVSLKGIESEGMFCSIKELSLEESAVPFAKQGEIIVFEPKTKLGVCVKKILGLDEVIFNISVTANRPDCKSIYGMAREISAVLERPLRPLNLAYKQSALKNALNKRPVKIVDNISCSRYIGAVVEDLTISESPEFIKKRLSLVGLTPINNIVDITNFVLFEVGQPLHAFDIEKIKNEIIVRKAKSREQIKLLDGKEKVLENEECVIADSEKPLAIAGVMGGEYSGVSSDTKTIFLEAARFARGAIRNASRKLGIKTDSSSRFESGVDYESVEIGTKRALHLIEKFGVGSVSDYKVEDGIEKPKAKKITTSEKEISSLLGTQVSRGDIIKILNSIQIKTAENEDKIVCQIPLFREDIDGYQDIAEEVIRFYGYNKIKPTPFNLGNILELGVSEKYKKIQAVKERLIGHGCFEAITYSFVSEKLFDMLLIPAGSSLRNTIKLKNPLTEEYSIMRTQLAGSMLSVVKTNLNRKNDNFRLFEVAQSYNSLTMSDINGEITPCKSFPVAENEILSIAFVGNSENFYSLKAAVCDVLDLFKVKASLSYSSSSFLHPKISAAIEVSKQNIGSFGKVHPKVLKNFDIQDENVYICELNLYKLLSFYVPNIISEELPKYPSVLRDIAIIVKDEYLVGDLIKCIKKAGAELVESVRLFDIYTGEQIEKGFKSVAFNVVLRSSKKTLQDEEIRQAMNNIIRLLKEKFSVRVRE